MAFLDDLYDIHPIDIAESIARAEEWDFERGSDETISFAIEGAWRNYLLLLDHVPSENSLRLMCRFDMAPQHENLPKLYEMLNTVNAACWIGSFTWDAELQHMVFRYGLLVGEDQLVDHDQIATMISAAVLSVERFLPAFELAIWTDKSPDEALQTAIAQAYGHA